MPLLSLLRYAPFFDGLSSITYELRDARLTTGEQVVFEQRDVHVPTKWSQTALNIAAQKYLRVIYPDTTRTSGTGRKENSIQQMMARIATTLGEWGIKDGYFESGGEAVETFQTELQYLLLSQRAAFNSPVFFNLGVSPNPVCSACFVLGVEDNMNSILDLARTEGTIFKNGAGIGLNGSPMRSRRERLSGGGTASGPLSFMRGLDSMCGVIKAGGTCLAPNQLIYTEHGPVAVKDLARCTKFIVLSYDPPAGRYKAKWAKAWKSGRKQLVRITTDKGSFDLSYDHPVRLSSHDVCRAGDLSAGMSLFSCTVDRQHGHLRVGLHDGNKGKEFFHRLIAQDIMGHDLRGKVVHHHKSDVDNNAVTNLKVTTQSRHARHHGLSQARRGNHVFQLCIFDHAGTLNGMHHRSKFWRRPLRVRHYVNKQRELLLARGSAASMQQLSARQQMLNTGFKLLNLGCDISNFDAYVEARQQHLSRIGSKTKLKRSLIDRFGSYRGYLRELSAGNHRVVKVEHLGKSTVYDVEVDCPTADDKSNDSGHNFVIWPDSEFTGSGIAVFNTRRAAVMRILDCDHLDLLDFVWCKAHEEKKARALKAMGFEATLDKDITFWQNSNLSVRVTDDFMRAVRNHDQWTLRGRHDTDMVEVHDAAELFHQLAQAAHACGDPGLQFHDAINRMHTCPSLGPIVASNPCQPAWATVLIPKGVTTIGEVNIGDLIWSGSQWTAVVQKVCSGVNNVYAYHTRAGVFYGTKNHRVVSNGEKVEVDSAESIDIARTPVPQKLTLDPQDIMDGLVLGDGSVHNASARLVYLIVGSKDESWYKSEVKPLFIKPRMALKQGAWEIKTTLKSSEVPVTYRRKIPKRFRLGAPDKMAGFLRGLYSANGSVCGNRVTLKASSVRVIRAAQVMLSALGIRSYYTVNPPHDVTFSNGTYRCRQSYDLNITADRGVFHSLIGFIQPDKQERLRIACQTAERNWSKSSYEILDKKFIRREPTYDLTVDSPEHTYWTGGLLVSNCGEYNWINWSACNLASINLLSFYQPHTREFDLVGFQHAVKLMTIAQDIIIANATYPDPRIAENVRKTRTIGIGYSNLGALLLNMQLPYDSEDGRLVAAAITAVMTGTAYLTSHELAQCLGAFPAWSEQQNREAMLEVLQQHETAAKQQLVVFGRTRAKLGGPDLYTVAGKIFTDVIDRLSENLTTGLRNAQVSLLAPNGTIGFVMGCETTGIEPIYRLVTTKNMVGGSSMKVGINSLPQVLGSLGYSPPQVEEQLEYLAQHEELVGAPHLESKHWPIFATAVGQNSISPSGHLLMLAAVQPFLSSGISKTVNLPHSATVADVEQAYLDAWRLGLKSVAVYCDGSKHQQPLAGASTGATGGAPVPFDANQPLTPLVLGQALRDGLSFNQLRRTLGVSDEPRDLQITDYTATKWRLPTEIYAVRYKFQVGQVEGYLHVGMFPDTNRPGEIFIRLAKVGSTLAGLLDSFARSVSHLLQHGVPLEVLCKHYKHTKFEPCGITGSPEKELRFADSIIDHIFRWLERRFIVRRRTTSVPMVQLTIIPEPPMRYVAGMLLIDEPERATDDRGHIHDASHLDEADEEELDNEKSDHGAGSTTVPPRSESTGDICTVCGAMLQTTGTCSACPNCGESNGCS